MGLEYIEKKIALATTPDAGKNLYKAVVSRLDEAIQEVIPLDCHLEIPVYMFMVFFTKMSVVYHKTYPSSTGYFHFPGNPAEVESMPSRHRALSFGLPRFVRRGDC